MSLTRGQNRIKRDDKLIYKGFEVWKQDAEAKGAVVKKSGHMGMVATKDSNEIGSFSFKNSAGYLKEEKNMTGITRGDLTKLGKAAKIHYRGFEYNEKELANYAEDFKAPDAINPNGNMGS